MKKKQQIVSNYLSFKFPDKVINYVTNNFLNYMKIESKMFEEFVNKSFQNVNENSLFFLPEIEDVYNLSSSSKSINRLIDLCSNFRNINYYKT